MKVVLVFLILAALLAAAVSLSGCIAGASPGNGTLEGNVTVGPLTPVERADATPLPPPPEVFTGRHLVVYAADGTTKVADVGIVPAGYRGHYRVSLPAGVYVLDHVHQGIGSASPLPARVTIEEGRTTIVDVDFDTGIR